MISIRRHSACQVGKRFFQFGLVFLMGSIGFCDVAFASEPVIRAEEDWKLQNGGRLVVAKTTAENVVHAKIDDSAAESD